MPHERAETRLRSWYRTVFCSRVADRMMRSLRRWRCRPRSDTLSSRHRGLIMKLARRITALPLVFLVSAVLFTLQLEAFQRFGRRYYPSGPNVPSEFYWTRLMYNSAGGSGGFRFFG